ncbi:hypothetical protein BDF22DRAFT_49636 [Syncephalis plumigaleata]|nr:hypothetical protein BDF22DRAFT_49636 [Syncephalis plumigaleata]
MIIAFLVDTSPYMDQCFSDGANLLTAVKKAAIDMVQQLETTSTSVRYLLVTYGKEATSVKCDLSTTSNQMLYALQQLSSNNNDSWNPGDALRTLFNTLSVDRTMRNVDTFGRGRIPGMNEPVKIIWCSYGDAYYKEIKRWKYRVHLILVLNCIENHFVGMNVST